MVEGGNVVHHVKREGKLSGSGNVRRSMCGGGHVQGEMFGSQRGTGSVAGFYTDLMRCVRVQYVTR